MKQFLLSMPSGCPNRLWNLRLATLVTWGWRRFCSCNSDWICRSVLPLLILKQNCVLNHKLNLLFKTPMYCPTIMKQFITICSNLEYSLSKKSLIVNFRIFYIKTAIKFFVLWNKNCTFFYPILHWPQKLFSNLKFNFSAFFSAFAS